MQAPHDTWDAAQYHRFRDERRQPFLDLLHMVRPAPSVAVVDLGCGSGELTVELHRGLRATQTTGIDTSQAMLSQAPGQEDGVRFVQADVATYDQPGGFDLVFSNACLQWIDGHRALMPRLGGMVRPGGQLAFQVPANHDHPSHTLTSQLAAEEPFRSALDGYVRISPVLLPEEYAALLFEMGMAEQSVCLQVYPHELASTHECLEWIRGTLLTDYRRRLPDDLYREFESELGRRLLARFGDQRPFFYPFKRILAWSRRPAPV
ncbi:MAG: methyltransferase domain-containing protein [Candidatus Dormibacteria bacterium]